MHDYMREPTPAQPVKESVKRILVQTIINAREPSEQKTMIMSCYESGIFSCPETFAFIHVLGLKEA